MIETAKKGTYPMQPFLITVILSLSLHSTLYAAETCPSVKGTQLSNDLFMLTGAELTPQQPSTCVPELADPAPPFVTADGKVEIYGSATYFIQYPNWEAFSRAGEAKVVHLDLRDPHGNQYDANPWDLRKYRLQSQRGSREILVGGALNPSKGRSLPIWPEDNPSRRLYVFNYHPQRNAWIREKDPIIGTPESGWIGHSYGGNFFQDHQRDAGLLDTTAGKKTYFFYEKVNEIAQMADGQVGPYKTEIYATSIDGETLKASGDEVKVIDIGNPPVNATRRTIGGHLVEGPRPIHMSLGSQNFYVIGFSSSDFPTDSYQINYAWSEHVLGPYKVARTSSGEDYRDLGLSLKDQFGLSWVGRPVFYQTPAGCYEMMFHGVTKKIRPDNDYRRWPVKYQLWDFFRSLFKVKLHLSMDQEGGLIIRPIP